MPPRPLLSAALPVLLALPAAAQAPRTWIDALVYLEVRALAVGQSCRFAIEAFDENGVSAASAPLALP